jgi:hypothetical protein
MLVSSPDPTLEEGKGSDELRLNVRFLFYGVHCRPGATSTAGTAMDVPLFVHKELATYFNRELEFILAATLLPPVE